MKVSIVMPAFNESSGIEGFIDELLLCCEAFDIRLYVVDDESTDGMNRVLNSLSEKNKKIHVVRNTKNLGHGPSTVKALLLGLESGSEVIVALDGDGQFLGSDVAEALRLIESKQYDVIEGVRKFRKDPLYRRFVSWVTRLFVFFRSGKIPKDANTPLRVYQRSALDFLLRELDPDVPIPNLLISYRTRRSSLQLFELPVTSISRRGEDANSVTWNSSDSFLPSSKFVKFIASATKEFWVRS
jgi:dolichol-phosphate mannosyltransferase